MSHDWGFLAGVITLILFATFVGIWIWAWRKRHRATFNALSRLPMEDAESERNDPARSANTGKQQ
jgi:cytochrome c oxidase cbb3-type subunit IV